MKYAFVAEHTVQFAVRTMCRVLAISRSGYYEWLSRGPSRRVQQDAGLIQAIYRVHLASGRAYGALKTWRTLQAQGIRCGKHQVARLRKAVGIETQRSRRFRQRRTYTSCLPEPNLLQGCFNVAAPNRVWAGDISYIRTGTGALNLAVLIDLYSRRVVGWSLSPNPDERLVSAALAMALRQRQPHPGLVHHTDQGAVYRAQTYRNMLQAHQIRQSLSAKGNPYDNAVVESFFSTLKNELVHHRKFVSREEAHAEIRRYIEVFYNRQRIHQALGYQTPVQVDRCPQTGVR